MKKRIILVRHGRQNSSKCNVDVDLSPEGILQAELLAKRLEGQNFDIMYTSKLKRAIQTGDIINQVLKINVERRAGINEIDWGDIVGLDNKERIEKYSSFMHERLLRNSDLPFPGGESGKECFSRAYPVIKEIIDSSYNSIIVVTHGGLIRSLICGLLNLPFKEKLAFGSSLENTSLTQLIYDSETNLFTLETFNDYYHLIGHTELMRSSWMEK